MKTIQIDDDIFSYIASKTTDIGRESPSEILRRLLGVSKKETSILPQSGNIHHEWEAHLTKTEFLVLNSGTKKFLHILGIIAKEKGPLFEKILEIQGRDRKYFAKSEGEILQSGQSTHPKKIPGTQYWVMTNLSTLDKRRRIGEVMKLFQYSKPAMDAVRFVIG